MSDRHDQSDTMINRNMIQICSQCNFDVMIKFRNFDTKETPTKVRGTPRNPKHYATVTQTIKVKLSCREDECQYFQAFRDANQNNISSLEILRNTLFLQKLFLKHNLCRKNIPGSEIRCDPQKSLKCFYINIKRDLWETKTIANL